MGDHCAAPIRERVPARRLALLQASLRIDHLQPRALEEIYHSPINWHAICNVPFLSSNLEIRRESNLEHIRR